MSAFGTLRDIATHPLNLDGPTKALMRFARWQIASRLIKHPIALPFVNETQMLVKTGQTGATGNYYHGLLEPEEMTFTLHALRPGELFADVGANVGAFSVMVAGAVGGQVIAIEPVSETFAALTANLRLNQLDNVEAHRCGLGADEGKAQFTTALGSENRVSVADNGAGCETVPIRTLDNVCAGRIPKVIKIDVEGYEMEVLNGAKYTLAHSDIQAVVMETCPAGKKYGVEVSDLFAVMEGYGFVGCGYDWRTRLLHPVNRGAYNTIFVRDVPGVNAKCQASPRYQLVNGQI